MARPKAGICGKIEKLPLAMPAAYIATQLVAGVVAAVAFKALAGEQD
jgi:hypothetical protein